MHPGCDAGVAAEEGDREIEKRRKLCGQAVFKRAFKGLRFRV